VDVVFLIARILFVIIAITGAIGHFLQADAMTQYANYKGAPGGKFGVIASGVGLGLGGVMVLLGIYGDLGALIIAATLIPISIFMHAFWKESDAQAKMTEQVAFNKNLALIGGALAIFVFFAATDPALSITGPLFAA